MTKMMVPGLKGRGTMEGKSMFDRCRVESEAIESFGGEARTMGNESPSRFICYPAG